MEVEEHEVAETNMREYCFYIVSSQAEHCPCGISYLPIPSELHKRRKCIKLKISNCLQGLSATTNRRKGYLPVSSSPVFAVVAPAAVVLAPDKSIPGIESS